MNQMNCLNLHPFGQRMTGDATAEHRVTGGSFLPQLTQRLGLSADFGRKAAQTSGTVSMYGPPMRSMQ